MMSIDCLMKYEAIMHSKSGLLLTSGIKLGTKNDEKYVLKLKIYASVV